MLVDLYNYAWCCVTDTRYFPFTYTMKVPLTDFNQSQLNFQAMPSNTGLTLAEHHGKDQSRYTILHINQYQDRWQTVLANISYI